MVQIRFLMILTIGLVVVAILSVAAVQQFGSETGSSTTTPPDPLTVSPDTAAEQTR